jgi:putative membrane protein
MKLNIPNHTAKQAKIIELIVIFNLVGLIGFMIPATRHIFMLLVPWHLLLMGIFIALSHEKPDRRFIVFLMITYLVTFFGEWLGVHTSWLFGIYHYGRTMGCKLWDIPLIMGITWFLLIYSAGVLMQRSRVRNMLLRVVMGSVLLVLLDLLIEPIAARFDYWHWLGHTVPLKNYWGWLMVSVVMLFVFEAFRFKKQSLVGPVLLLMQFLFFGVLNLVYMLYS